MSSLKSRIESLEGVLGTPEDDERLSVSLASLVAMMLCKLDHDHSTRDSPFDCNNHAYERDQLAFARHAVAEGARTFGEFMGFVYGENPDD